MARTEWQKTNPLVDHLLVREIPAKLIVVGRYVSRSSHGTSTWADGLGALAEDIGRQGQLEPAIVIPTADDPLGPRYDLVVGHRRAEACKILDRPLLCCVLARPRTEYDIWQMVWAENVLREDWTPVERADMEARLKDEAERAGIVTSRERPRPGVPTYSQLRASQTDESEKTIENYVALGQAAPALKDAVEVAAAKQKDIRRSAAITVSGGYSLARFDHLTQQDTLDFLHSAGINRAGPQEVAAAVNAVRQRAGLPAIKNGMEYEPSPETKTLGAEIAVTKTINRLVVEALEFYAEDANWAGMIYYHGERQSPSVMDYGDRARQTLAKLSLALDTDAELVKQE